MTILEQLKEIKACNDAIEWIESEGFTSLNQAWAKCHRSDWMIWALDNFDHSISDKDLRLFAVRCARSVQHLITDERSINAIDIAERHAHGNATDEELATAGAAAGAAARDAVWAAAGDEQAVWLREITLTPFTEVSK
jgi:hypothetical protein